MDLTSILIVVAITLAALFSASYSYAAANLNDVKDNWVKYRCNPVYMPLAGLVGSDVLTNFMGCTMSSFQTYIALALDPIYKLFGVVGGTLSQIQGTLNSFRGMITGTKDAFASIVAGIYAKLNNTLGTTVRLVGRIRNLTQRILGVFVTIFHMVNTGVQTGESVANGPVGKAAEFFCFAPSTPVTLANGLTRAISHIHPGDKLIGGVLVESVLVLDGSLVQMYRLDRILVSGNHKVLYKNKWIRVENHPLSILVADKFEALFCLNTSNNTIPIGRFIFKDYEETSDIKLLARFESIVESLHNTSMLPANAIRRKKPLEYRHSGTSLTTDVLMKDGSKKPIYNIKIGDEVAKGGKVLGLVMHKPEDTHCYLSKDLPVSKGTWVFDTRGKDIYTAEVLGQVSYNTEMSQFVCMNLLTEYGYVTLQSDGRNFTILDDQETIKSWVHGWRDIQVQKETVV